MLHIILMAVPLGVWSRTAWTAGDADTTALPADTLTTLLPDTAATGAAAGAAADVAAQEAQKAQTDSSSRRADVPIPLSQTDARMLRAKRTDKIFLPDPNRAAWLALVFPGGGQIYNRKYWKLPIFYGGFLGCFYAFTWNQQMYMDYSQAYLDIMDDNPNTNSYLAMFPPSYDIDNNTERFKTVFKNRKDRFRRWRDLSAFCFVGVYLLSVIDAYVDAHLSAFDISDDLSLHLSPTTISGAPGQGAGYGLGATFSF